MAGSTGWGIALEAIGNLGEGISGVIGSNQISGIQTNAIDQATATSNKYYNTATGYQQPYAQMGLTDTQKMDQMINSGAYVNNQPFNFQGDPGYQYQLAQGNQNIQQRAAGMGQMFSGATLKALQKYGNNLANQSYQEAFNRYTNQRNFNQANLNEQYNRYQNQSLMGQKAANSLTGMATEQGNTLAGLQIARGNVEAQRVASNVGNTQGVFKSIADVGGGLAGGMGGGQGGGGSSYNQGMAQNNSMGMLGNGAYQNYGMTLSPQDSQTIASLQSFGGGQ